MNAFRAALLGMMILLVPACGKSKEEAPAATGPVLTPHFSGEASVPPGSNPPVGLVWNVGFTENVSLAEMEAQYAKFVALSQDLWNLTEGQVCLSTVRFYDNVAPGAKASGNQNIRVPALDVLLYSVSGWDILPIGGQVLFYSPSGYLGRTDRRIDLPVDAARLTIAHEGSHFVWRLSWSAKGLPPGLDDEYAHSPRDPACVMDASFMPLRWCSGGSLPSPNHVTKDGGQGAVSCWEQIKTDYPSFGFSGGSSTSSPLPPLEVEYNDLP